MARKVITMARTGPWAQRWAVRLSLVLIVAAGLFFIRTVLAVHETGAFELDGDASADAGLPGVDWDSICHEVSPANCPTDPGPSGAIAKSWVAELDENASIFTGGGSKDPEDIDQWAWKDGAGGLPDKDNLLHSFAARYSLTPTDPLHPTIPNTCSNGTGFDLNDDGDAEDDEIGEVVFNPNLKCEVLYFGSDRLDNSGDAHQAFWFFQNRIELGDEKLGGGFNFTGVHKNGDLLVISNFSNGGETSTIFVFVWDDTFDGNLRPLSDPEGVSAFCGTAPDDDAFCGIVNNAISQPATLGLITMPWPFVDKSGTANNGALIGEFYEGGVNLSLLGLGGECFASVASETRASTSLTATLKDFVLGPLAECASGLVTTPVPDANVFPGATIGDSALLTITGTTTWSGTMHFFLCGPAQLTPANTGTCTTGGTEILPAVPVTQASTQPILSATTTAPSTLGKYCWRGFFDSATDGVPDATDASEGECFEVVQITPTISTTQTYTVQDSATITASAGGNLAGSVRFRLYNNTTCTPSGTTLADQTVAVAGASPQTVGTTAITLTTPANATTSLTLSWLVEYTSTNPAQGGVTSACNVEGATLSVDNTQ